MGNHDRGGVELVSARADVSPGQRTGPVEVVGCQAGFHAGLEGDRQSEGEGLLRIQVAEKHLALPDAGGAADVVGVGVDAIVVREIGPGRSGQLGQLPVGRRRTAPARTPAHAREPVDRGGEVAGAKVLVVRLAARIATAGGDHDIVELVFEFRCVRGGFVEFVAMADVLLEPRVDVGGGLGQQVGQRRGGIDLGGGGAKRQRARIDLVVEMRTGRAQRKN